MNDAEELLKNAGEKTEEDDIHVKKESESEDSKGSMDEPSSEGKCLESIKFFAQFLGFRYVYQIKL